MMTIQTTEITSTSLAHSRFALYIQWLRFTVLSLQSKEVEQAALRINIKVYYSFMIGKNRDISSYTK